MNSEMDKKYNNEEVKSKNAFNDLRLFLYLLLCTQVLLLFYALRQMLFENIDSSPVAAAAATVLLPMTIYHIRKLKKDD